MEPLPRMSTTYIEPGEHTFDDLVSDIKHGVYIKNFTEWNIDDPSMKGSFGFYVYDDEGVQSRKRYLYRRMKGNGLPQMIHS